MNNYLRGIIEWGAEAKQGESIKVDYNELYHIFRTDHNPLKGETPQSEITRWLDKLSCGAFHYDLKTDKSKLFKYAQLTPHETLNYTILCVSE